VALSAEVSEPALGTAWIATDRGCRSAPGRPVGPPLATARRCRHLFGHATRL